jgi:hypothetical protein
MDRIFQKYLKFSMQPLHTSIHLMESEIVKEKVFNNNNKFWPLIWKGLKKDLYNVDKALWPSKFHDWTLSF